VAALNTGLALINSEYVARFDSDDIMFPERLEKQVEFLDKHPEILAVGSQIMLIDEAGREMHIHSNPTNQTEMVKVIGRRTPMAHPSVMFRTKAVTGVGGYREFYKYAEDYDLWMRLFEVGKIINLEDCLVWYRIHKSQISKIRTEAQAIATQAVLVSHRLRKKGHPDLNVSFESPDAWYEAIPKGLFKISVDGNAPRLREILDSRYQEAKSNAEKRKIYFYAFIQLILRPRLILKVTQIKLSKFLNENFQFYPLIKKKKYYLSQKKYLLFSTIILLLFVKHPKQSFRRLKDSILIKLDRK
jgi:glycosyltransferase involved in cell wall biosynthesis